MARRLRYGDPGYVYTPRGRTRKPCPGCGQEGGARPAHGVCYDCERKLARYQELEAAAAALVAGAGKEPYHVARGGQYFSIPGDGPSWREREAWAETGRALERAQIALALAAGDPVPPPAVPARNDQRERMLWTEHAGQPSDWYDGSWLLFRPEAAAAFDALDRAIRAALRAAWTAGRMHGSSLLGRLAAGEVSVDEFNRRTMEGER